MAKASSTRLDPQFDLFKRMLTSIVHYNGKGENDEGRDRDTSGRELATFLIIASEEGSYHTIGTLMDRLNAPRSAVQRVVDRLVESGLIYKEYEENPRHVYLVRDNKSGAAFVRRLNKLLASAEHEEVYEEADAA
jgi:predicted transcriptional regulator